MVTYKIIPYNEIKKVEPIQPIIAITDTDPNKHLLLSISSSTSSSSPQSTEIKKGPLNPDIYKYLLTPEEQKKHNEQIQARPQPIMKKRKFKPDKPIPQKVLRQHRTLNTRFGKKIPTFVTDKPNSCGDIR